MRYPWYVIWVRPEDIEALHTMIKDLLAILPMSQRELARALEVDQSTVSRWAAGQSVPSLEEMRGMVRIAQARIAEVETRLNQTTEFVDAAEACAKTGLEGIQAMRRVQQLLTAHGAGAPRRSKRRNIA